MDRLRRDLFRFYTIYRVLLKSLVPEMNEICRIIKMRSFNVLRISLIFVMPKDIKPMNTLTFISSVGWEIVFEIRISKDQSSFP